MSLFKSCSGVVPFSPANAPGGPFGTAAGAALLPLALPAPVEAFLSLLHAAAINATPISAAINRRRRPLLLAMHVLHWAGTAGTLDRRIRTCRGREQNGWCGDRTGVSP